jgi:hypothetical protein
MENIKWITYKYTDGVTISCIYNELLDGEWTSSENEIIVEIPRKYYINEYED